MEVVTEDFVLSEGRSLLDMRVNPFGATLLIDGAPIVLTMPDNAGSVAEYLLRAGVTNLESKLTKLRHIVEGNFVKSVPMRSQIFPFLELFAPGTYQLCYYESCPDSSDFIEFKSSWETWRAHDNFYPWDFNFVLTQPTDSLNVARINYFVERIRSGHRPIALTATVQEEILYVLDGHHKMQAYQELKIAPAFISVQRLDPEKLTFDPFESWFPNHPLKQHYRRYNR